VPCILEMLIQRRLINHYTAISGNLKEGDDVDIAEQPEPPGLSEGALRFSLRPS
jgi:hypothetical protein